MGEKGESWKVKIVRVKFYFHPPPNPTLHPCSPPNYLEILPGDFLFQGSRVGWVKLDTQTHGEWRLGWEKRQPFKVVLFIGWFMFFSLSFLHDIFKHIMTLVKFGNRFNQLIRHEILTFHLFGNGLWKLQPMLKRRGRQVNTCTEVFTTCTESLAAELSVWGLIAQQQRMITCNL